MARAATFFVLALVLTAPTVAHALATEQLGNKPIAPGWGFDAKLLDAVNVEERVYWYEVNGNPTFYFKGSPKAVNEAIRRFAAIPAPKSEIVLLPGPGITHTLQGKPVAYDWALHDPMGLSFGGDSDVADSRATLTIHLNSLTPPPPTDPAKVKLWIGELGSDDFKTRERAARELAGVGPATASLIREALKETKSPEVRDRLERVLAKISTEIRLDFLGIPLDVSVVSVEILLERARKELSNKAPDVRGHSATSLRRSGISTEEIVPDLQRVLKSEKHEYPLRCAASVASSLGAVAKPLLPELRELLKSEDKNVQHVAQYAIDTIEKAKPEAVPEADAKLRAAIRKEIREFVAERAKKEK
jgi:hypothetical protein